MSRRDRPPRIGLALAGGGFLGVAYELGALAALAESIDGLDLTQLDVYVGVSAGAFVAAGLANGVGPHEMVRLFVESEDTGDTAFDPATLLRPAWSELLRRGAAAPQVVGKIAQEAWRGFVHGSPSAAVWRGSDRAATLLPSGLVDASPAERKLERMLSAPGRSNRFDGLAATLRIVATDLDSGEAVAFGAPGHEDVPVSRAVVASAAVPGLFPPVEVKGRHFVDGALNKTLHASVALNEGATLVLCVNPLVPFDAVPLGRGAIARSGLGAVLSQTVRTTIRSRMATGMEKYRATHPAADVLLFEPRRDDATTFFTRIFSVASRRELCEHAYRQTRADLLARASELEPALARHGLRLAVERLARRSPRLVRTVPRPRPPRRGRLRTAVTRLEHALEDLERALRRAD